MTAAAHYIYQILICLPYLLLMPLHVIVKGKDIIWEQMQGHNSQISYARQTKHVKDKQKQTESSFSHVSVSPLSKNLSPTHCSQLFRVQWGLLVWFLVCFIDPGIRAVHALCPLPIDHSPLLLTDSPVEKKQFRDNQSQLPVIDSIAADVLVPSVLDMTLHSVKLFIKHAVRFEV